MDWDRLKDEMNAQMDHVAIAVPELEGSVATYRALGLMEYCGRETVASQQVELAVFDAGGARIELLAPISPQSPISRFLEQRGGGLHHVAFKVNDIGEALQRCLSQGIKPLGTEPVRGAGGCLIIFLDPKTTGGVLIELTQDAPAE